MAKNPIIIDKNSSSIKYFPPVVAVVGHVDHGKTTLLDAIRKSDIASREHGGITQKIGASTVLTMHEDQKRRITFIDTPGHEAFSKMRGRGTMASDIGLLVVSAVDGVMPQTRESINLLLDAKIPFIAVLTKADLPTKNVEKVKQELIRENVLLEGYGGDVPVIEVSAREGKNVKELLDLILLLQEIHPQEPAPKPEDKFRAIVIESKLDTKIGPKITVVIKNGTISVKDDIFCENAQGRVRSLITSEGQQIISATIGDAVEILGFSSVPSVGSIVYKKADAVIEKKPDITPMPEVQQEPSTSFLAEVQTPPLTLILCTDTLGSLEAIVNALPKEIAVLIKKTGNVSESDILFAKSTGAIVLSFNVKLRTEIQRLAEQENVLLKNYTIIYELIDEIKDALKGKQLALIEKVLGKAKILASFPYEKTQAYGIKVTEGRMAKGDRARVEREDTVVGETSIASLRIGKNPVSKAENGQEAGLVFAGSLDITIGDMIICHR